MFNIQSNNKYKEIELWKKKLLDLGKRNNLMNYRDKKSSTLEVLSPCFYDLFNKITTTSRVQIFDDNSLYDDDEQVSLFEFDDDDDKVVDKDSFIKKNISKVPTSQIFVYNGQKPTKNILKTLYRKSSEAMTERGVNILYMAFGFLKWKESFESNIFYKSPIVLVPITINCSSINGPYFIEQFDDDIQINSSLQYMLENQFGINFPPFEDHTLSDYIERIRIIVGGLGWDILEEVRISTFSFNKLNMYLDLDKNSEKIMSNKNVAALTDAETDGSIFIGEEDIDKVSNSRDLFIKQHNVVDADFSQTEAIEYAMMGKSFVLQGPPGTGKSQTITNIIAELIYAGKKVLFVSEKMAALEVVFNNMKKANLSDYCLELHSYKANKKTFIDDLYNTMMLPKTVVGEKANSYQSVLADSVKSLNNYDISLYKVYQPINMTLFQLIGLENHYKTKKDIPYIVKDFKTIDINKLEGRCLLLKRLCSYKDSIGYNYKNHPLYGLVINDSSYAFKLEFSKLINDCLKNITGIINKGKQIYSIYGVDNLTIEELDSYINFIDFCVENKFDNNKLFDLNFLDYLINTISELINLNSEIDNNSKIVLQNYNIDILNENIEQLLDDYKRYGFTFIKRCFDSKYKYARRIICSYRNKKHVSYRDCLDELNLIKKLKDEMQSFDEREKAVSIVGLLQYKGKDTNWSLLNSNLKNLKSLLLNKNFIVTDFSEHNKQLLNDTRQELIEYKILDEKINKFIDHSIINFSKISMESKFLLLNKWYNNLSKVDVWIEFYMLLCDLHNNNLIDFIDEFLSLNYPLTEIENSYRFCFYRQWVDEVFSSDSCYTTYNRKLHEEDLSKFIIADETQLKISQAKINERLSSIRPDPMLQMPGSPAKIIIREHEKKKKIKPIRTVMKSIPDFIQGLKPCFLMSPLSVSTYLSDNINFDVTIFDEASQVFPEDAIVAIYRSKQLIVVGDSKQMPPSKFFMSQDNDDDEYEEDISDVDAYESILDLCTTAFPTKSLLCHYRSRDEHLINFSNKNFYGYNLITYPSIYGEKKDLGVEFIYVPNGVMDSRLKINLLEAEKVVDAIFDHFRTNPHRSLGVVAFNIKQQECILKMLDKRREKDTSLEEFFNPDREEPFFVKNLETVQGDERDTIIFSITYAKNDKGQFALRFGPLNLVGGERRLNVAITRAKYNVKVVSSIRSFDIDVSRVSNDGPKLLHDYLDYAENGDSALERAISVTEEVEFDSPFEQDVYEFLKEKGFDVTTQVGCSKYRIDLGLKRPGTSDYVLAIECDGATYHSAKSARDRDRLRQSILERMNWKFYRIWSTDWYRNNAIEKQSLLNACKNALANNETEINKKKQVNIDALVSKQKVNGSVVLYDTYDICRKVNGSNTTEITEEVTAIEGPISVDFLLKRICSMWGYEKATQNVKKIFYRQFHSNKVLHENGFLFFPEQRYYAMRKDAGSLIKDINYISKYELRNGMYAAIEQNGSCKKDDLFAFIRSQLGFDRSGDKIKVKLDEAFIELKPYILIDSNDYISINNNNRLPIIHRKHE